MQLIRVRRPYGRIELAATTYCFDAYDDEFVGCTYFILPNRYTFPNLAMEKLVDEKERPPHTHHPYRQWT